MQYNYHAQHPGSRQEWSKFVDWLYPVPDPLRSEEDWIRAENLDLDELSKEEIRAELERARHRLLWDQFPPRWLVEVRVPELERRVRDGA